MDYSLSPHAAQVVAERNISLTLLEQVLEAPQQVLPEKEDRVAYQSIVELPNKKRVLLRVIVYESDPLIVVTVYYTSRIERYWRSE